MVKNILITTMFLSVLPYGMKAQDIMKKDTVRTELQSQFIEEIGDTTNLVVRVVDQRIGLSVYPASLTF